MRAKQMGLDLSPSWGRETALGKRWRDLRSPEGQRGQQLRGGQTDMRWGRGTPGGDSQDGPQSSPQPGRKSRRLLHQEGTRSAGRGHPGPGLEWQAARDKGQMCWVHPGDGLGEENEDPPLHHHPPRGRRGPLSCSGSHAPSAPHTVLHWTPSAQDGPGLPQGL